MLCNKIILSIQNGKTHIFHLKKLFSSTATPSFLSQHKATECQIHGAGKSKKKAKLFSTNSIGILHV